MKNKISPSLNVTSKSISEEMLPKIFESEDDTLYILSAGIRPDGKYAIAIMGCEDPDFPSLVLADIEKSEIITLESDEGYGIIDWPGEHISWPENDFSPIAFDRLNGFTTFELLSDECKYNWLGSTDKNKSDRVSEEWWVTFLDNGNKQVRFRRLRKFKDNSIQVMYQTQEGDQYRYEYFLEYDDAKSFCHFKSIQLIKTDAGRINLTDCHDWIKQEEIDLLAKLINERKISIPEADNDKALACKLTQSFAVEAPIS